MVYDLRTYDSANNFILKLMNMAPEEYSKEFSVKCNCNFDIFWKRNLSKIEKKDISELTIIAFHILGSLDHCREIKNVGIINLQEILKRETLLSSLLEKKGIVFDLDKKTIRYNKKTFDIDYNNYRNLSTFYGNKEKLYRIAHRVYCDFCVNGFLVNDDIRNYGTDIHKRPEFLMILSDFLPEAREIEKYWAANSISYRVDFQVMINQVSLNTFDISDKCSHSDYENQLKRWLLYNAINRAYGSSKEVFLFLKDECFIPPHQIISYEKLQI